jgi:hypothetical protein
MDINNKTVYVPMAEKLRDSINKTAEKIKDESHIVFILTKKARLGN